MGLKAFIRRLILSHKVNQEMAVIPQHLRIALGEIGIAEIVGKRANKRILEYLRTVNVYEENDEIPWCSAFVNWCIEKSGRKGTSNALARSWMKWGVAIVKPRLGCVVIFKRGTEPWQGHVGLFLDRSNGYIYIVDGNNRDRGGVSCHKESKLLGYRWFDFKDL